MKKVIITIFLLLIIGSLGYNYLMSGGARNLENEEAAFSISSRKITSEFRTNPDVATQKYLNKAIQIKGIVTDVNDKQIILDKSIVCIMKNADNQIQKGGIYTIKGRFLGFDDLMVELKLDDCYLTK